jgi:putative drug exporter of the RND superfamily
MTESPHIPPRPDGALARGVRRAAGVAAARPRTAIAVWLVLVIGCVFAGGTAGTRMLTETEAGVGESSRADERIEAAGLRDPAVESVLVRSDDAHATGAAADALTERLDRVRAVTSVQGPRDAAELASAGGRTVLVQAKLRGDPDDAAKHAGSVRDAVAATAREHGGAKLQQAGVG